jgi:hypothetical protein
MPQGLPGHNGLLCVIYSSTVYSLTAVEGATWNWALNTAEWGGFGNGFRRATMVMPGPCTIDINEFAWDSTTLGDLLHDIMDAALSGFSYTYYLYPQGGLAGGTTQYLYGSFIPSELSVDVPIDDLIKQPFGLIQAGSVYRVGM